VDPLAKRRAIWKQLIADPNRDIHTIQLVCMEEGIEPSIDYVLTTRARWRNTIEALRAEGHTVPG